MSIPNNFDKSFEISNGLSLGDIVFIGVTNNDPSISGYVAPINSFLFGTNGNIYYKSGINDTEWILKTPILNQITDIQNVNTDYTVLTTDRYIIVDRQSNPVTITLYSAIGNEGNILDIRIIDSLLAILTIQPYGSELIQGQNNLQTKVKGTNITIISNGIGWEII